MRGWSYERTCMSAADSIRFGHLAIWSIWHFGTLALWPFGRFGHLAIWDGPSKSFGRPNFRFGEGRASSFGRAKTLSDFWTTKTFGRPNFRFGLRVVQSFGRAKTLSDFWTTKTFGRPNFRFGLRAIQSFGRPNFRFGLRVVQSFGRPNIFFRRGPPSKKILGDQNLKFGWSKVSVAQTFSLGRGRPKKRFWATKTLGRGRPKPKVGPAQLFLAVFPFTQCASTPSSELFSSEFSKNLVDFFKTGLSNWPFRRKL